LEERLPCETKPGRCRTFEVLGRLHSIEGLAQSNNNAKLNYSAKHKQIVVGNECKSRGS
jgi:hypothetical protein